MVRILPRRRAHTAHRAHRAAWRRGKIFTISLAVMRIRGRTCLIACLVIVHAACGEAGRLFRQFEYEEDVYVSLDGSATVYVNSSIAALNALRGTAFDASPAARMQTESILYRTLWLFGVTFAAVAVAFGLVIWWVMRRPVRGSHHADTV
jgi:hypothetical protein